MVLGIRPPTRLAHAIPYALMGALFNASVGAVVKYSSSLIPTTAILFWRNFVGLIIVGLYIHYTERHKSFGEKLKTSRWRMHIIRSLSGLAGIFCYFYSLKYLPLSSAALLSNSNPLFVPLIAFLWLKSPLPHRIYWGIGTAFLGIILILQPGSEMLRLISLVALASGVFGAIAILAVRQAHYTEPASRTIFYYFLIATAIMGMFSFLNVTENWGNLTFFDLFLLIVIGILGTAYQLFLGLASKNAPMRLISPFFYTSVVFSMLLDVLFWHTQISSVIILGFFLVAFGASLVVLLYPKKYY